MWQTGASQIQPQLGAELRLVDGGELSGRHDPRASSISHVDDGPHDQGVILTVLGHLCVALVLKRQQITKGGGILSFPKYQQAENVSTHSLDRSALLQVDGPYSLTLRTHAPKLKGQKHKA